MHVFNQGKVPYKKAKPSPARLVSKRRALLTTAQTNEMYARQARRSHRVALREWAQTHGLNKTQMVAFEAGNIRSAAPHMDAHEVYVRAKRIIEDAFGK